jgi:hypothetical protein
MRATAVVELVAEGGGDNLESAARQMRFARSHEVQPRRGLRIVSP